MDIGKPVRKIDVQPERKTTPAPEPKREKPAPAPKKKEPVPA